MEHQNVARSSESKVGEVKHRSPQPRPSLHVAAHPLNQLQQALGNRAFGRFLQNEFRTGQPDNQGVEGVDPQPEHVVRTPEPKLEHSVNRTSFRAVIARTAPPAPHVASSPKFSSSARVSRDLDAEEITETSDYIDPAAVTAAFTLPTSAIPNAAEGETVSVPDISMPESLQIVDTDAIASTITYTPSITQAGVVSPFGATSWSNFNITGATVTAVPASAGGAASFTVTFTLENPITFNVTSPKTSIASENDPALTNSNYPTAASDLTPNMSVQGGKPPRTQFWARDLTIVHERFHCDERSRLAAAGAVQAQAWLNAQTAANVAEVQALIAQVPGRVITASQAAVGTVDQKETRAYGNGAASYQARATAISTRGALGTAGGGYP